MINLYPLLLDNVNVLDTFDMEGRTFVYPIRRWRTGWLFEREPRTPDNWALLTHPISAPVFRDGWIVDCSFESGNQRLTCKIAVHACGHCRDGTFFVTGIVIPSP